MSLFNLAIVYSHVHVLSSFANSVNSASITNIRRYGIILRKEYRYLTPYLLKAGY